MRIIGGGVTPKTTRNHKKHISDPDETHLITPSNGQKAKLRMEMTILKKSPGNKKGRKAGFGCGQ